MPRPVKTLPPVRPSAAIRVAYQVKLDRLIKSMSEDVSRKVLGQLKRRPAIMAQDASPAREAIDLMDGLGRKWQAQFDELAPELARWFATATDRRSRRALQASLRKGGFSVKFVMSPAANNAFQATVAENVALIKSIPAQYMTDVKGAVARSVATGRDLGSLTEALAHNHGITARRAAFIARDQNNKATATITRVRQQEAGITEAIWLHSAGGKTPRPTHVSASARKQRYNVAEGWLDPALGRRIWPGTEINCRCVARAVVPGFN